jgi:ribosomal protein L11 methyltransferase
MKRKSLWKVTVTTAPEAEDTVAELLSAVLNLPVAAYFDIEAGISTVTVYLQRKPHLPGKIRAVISTGLRRIKNCGLKIGPGKVVMARVRRENWAESWKRHFKPIEIIRGRVRHSVRAAPMARRGLRALPGSLLLKPSWSKRKARRGQVEIVLDPGLSFGTGHHPTTAFCLSEIVRFQKGGDSEVRCSDGPAGQPCLKTPSFLDLGTGSGILAIAAAKLGYSPVLAMDFDPEAVRVARANTHANRVRQKLTIRQGDVAKLPVRPRREYDLVCANLIANVLLAERRRIAAQVNPAGTLVLAGILKSEFREIEMAYQTLGLTLVSHRDEKEWRSGSFRFGSLKLFEQRKRSVGLIE